MATKRIKIGMGEGAVASAPQVLSSPGIGSCVALTLYDSALRIGGMAHVMLPAASDAGEDAGAYWCADTAVAALLRELCRRGTVRQALVAKMAGGAAMFSCYNNGSAGIGGQVIRSIKEILARQGIPLVGWDVAGHHGRTVELHLASGQMVVKAIGREDKSF